MKIRKYFHIKNWINVKRTGIEKMPLKEKERGLNPLRGAKGKENRTKRKVPTKGTVYS